MPAQYLIVRLTALGDLVFALEALAALRAAAPDARIDWVVEDRWEALLACHPGVQRRIVYPRRTLQRGLLRPWRWPGLVLQLGRHLRALRRERYDAVLELQGNLKGGLHALLARAERKIGFAAPRAREGSWRCVRERVAVPTPRPHREREGRLLVERLLGHATLPSPEALLPPQPEAATTLARWLEATFGAPRGPLVVLAPGTSAFAAFKRWPATRYRELATRLVATGHAVVVSAGPGERELALAAGARADGVPALFDGSEHGLPVYLELLRAATVLVAADSAPLHLAQAVGTPVVGLFGPKDPSVYGPWRGVRELLGYAVPCAPCGRRACPLPLCVQAVPSEAVFDAILRVREAAALRSSG